MAWSAALPAVLAVNPLALIVAVAVCTLVELVAGLIAAVAGSCSSAESGLAEDAAALKVEIMKTNYPEKFVENSKLQRQLIKVEKELERLRATRGAAKARAQRWCKCLRIAAYGVLVASHWRVTAARFTPAFVWPLGSAAAAPLQGAPPGGISVVGIVLLFWWGLGGRLSG